MFKNLLFSLCLILFSYNAYANDIYIEQVGDDLDLDITQDGQNNEVGDSSADAVFAGDNMTFAITQTGNTNTINATIKGTTYTGTWAFTGNSNAVDLLCSSGSTGNCDTVTLNVTTTGDDNTFDFDIGEVGSADNSTVAFTITGDNNVINTDVDGVSAAVSVTINNASSLSSNSGNSDEGVALNLNIDGNGDVNGHTFTLDVTGGGGTVDVVQSGVYDNTVNLDMTGDDFDVDISQTD